MQALATVAQKSFNGKFNAKIDFPIRHILLILILEVESLSIHYLISVLDHMLVNFEQHRMVQNIQNVVLFGKKNG